MKKIKKILLSLFLPVVMILTAGILSFASITETARALSGNGGGFFVGSNTTLNFNATISGSSATNGGGVYVSNGGTFNMNGGSISGNTATANGNNIYNSGTFTMTGGRVGTSGSSSSGYGVYNIGTMNLYGGNVYDNVYSSADIKTKMACNIAGTITLGDSATITVQDYAGTTPEYNIEVSSSRQSGTIVTFKGSTVEPILSKINVTGYDSESYAVKTKKDSSGNWTISLVENSYDFPSDWKTPVASTTYMTTTITPANITKIQFVATVPSGYTKIGTLSTGLPVYKGTTATEIAFVGGDIKAPYSSKDLFINLSALTSINFSAFSTSNVTNMYCMFLGCNNLTSLDLSKFSTSNVTNVFSMFAGCKNLTSLDVSSFNTTKVINMNSMFKLCERLTSLDVSNFDTSNVVRMDGMFNNCSVLTNLDLSNFNTSKVTNMEHMFNGCLKLKSLDVSNFNTTNVTDMNYMFSRCGSLTSLDVSNFDTSKVTDMSFMFSDCFKLTSLDLSSFNMAKVTSSTNMLNFGTSNKILTLKTPYNNSTAIAITTGSTLYNVETGAIAPSVPANTTTSQTYATKITLTFDANGGTCSTSSIVGYYGCSLSEIGKSLPTPTQSGYNFNGWYSPTGSRVTASTVLAFTSSTTLTARWTENTPTPDPDPPTPPDPDPDPPPPTDPGIEQAEYIIFTTIENVPSGLSKNNTFDYTRANGNTFFETGCTPTVYTNDSGTQVAFVGDYGDLIAPQDCSNMFAGMISLKWVIFRNYDTYDVTNMTSMFEGCDNLEFMEMLSIQTPNVTSMNSMFKECCLLRQIAFAEFDCISLEDASYMFYNCSSLGKNPLYSGQIRTGEIIGYIPAINYTYNLANAQYMFAGCGWDTFCMPYMFTNNLSNTNGMFENTNFKILDLSQFIAKSSDMEDIWGSGSCNVEAIYTPRYCNPYAFINNSNYYLASGSEPGVFSNYGYTTVPFSLCFVSGDKINDYDQCTFHLTINGWSDGDLSNMIETLINYNEIFSGSSNSFSFSTYNPIGDVYYLLPMPIAEYDENGVEGDFAGWIRGDGSVDPNQPVDRFSDSDFFKRWGWMNSPIDPDVYLQSIAWSDTTAQCISNTMGGTINIGGSTPYNDFYNNDRNVLSLVRYLPSVHYSDGSIFTGWYFENSGNKIDYYTNITVGENTDGIFSGKRSADSYDNYFSFPSGSSNFKANKTASEKEMQELLKLYNESKQHVLIPEDKKVTITELKLKKVS